MHPSRFSMQVSLSGSDAEHSMAKKTLFPKGAILDMQEFY